MFGHYCLQDVSIFPTVNSTNTKTKLVIQIQPEVCFRPSGKPVPVANCGKVIKLLEKALKEGS